ncbi:MFS transporter [Streptomyces flaveolus]|uniref:MFS transporter n=1 Tax=Streptomyces flaveolus TaxID=67297 RepID=UPI001670DAB3|nr:MFS transporter [Streptomyces flaveolus]GGQ91807.1 MFS transporter [Streptomyces flaveolus]
MARANEAVLSTGTGAAAPSSSKRVPLIGVSALLCTVTIAVNFMLGPLLPLMQRHYSIDVSAVTWVLTAMLLGSGAGFVLIPRLQDIVDDRTMLLRSGIVLTAGALIPAVVDTYPALLVGSAMLGFGSAAQMLPVGFLRRHLSGSSVATAVSVLIMATGTGVVVGMVGGGLTVKYLSLSTFFYLLAAAFAATTAALLAVVPHSRPASSARIGVGGTVWMIAWVTLVLLAMAQTSDWGNVCYLLLALGVVAGAAWVLAQRRSAAPVFDLAMLKRPYTTTACVASFLFGAVDTAFVLLVSYYTQTPSEVGYGSGTDALGTSLLMLPFALTMFISGKAAERVVQQGRPGAVLAAGAALCGLGLVWLAFAHDHTWQYLVGSALVGLGSRAGYSGSFAIPQLVVDEDQAGMAAGIPATAMMMGAAFGSAVTTTVLSLAYIPEIPGVPKPYLYTVGYLVAAAFPAGVLVATALSSTRHPGAFKALLKQGA